MGFMTVSAIVDRGKRQECVLNVEDISTVSPFYVTVRQDEFGRPVQEERATIQMRTGQQVETAHTMDQVRDWLSAVGTPPPDVEGV